MRNSIFLICLILMGKMFLKFILYITLISLNLLLALHKTTSQERITKNNECLFRPCLNGGLCTLNNDSSFSCKCYSNWTGNFCQFFIRPHIGLNSSSNKLITKLKKTTKRLAIF